MQTVILVMHLGRLQIDSNAFSIVCAIQVLLLWIRIQYFARVLQPTKNPFIETMRAVISEVPCTPFHSSCPTSLSDFEPVEFSLIARFGKQ